MDVKFHTQDVAFKQNLYFKFAEDSVKYKSSDVMDLVNKYGKQLSIHKPVGEPIMVNNKNWLVLDETTAIGNVLNKIRQFVGSSGNDAKSEKLFDDCVSVAVNDVKETSIIDYTTAVNYFSSKK